MIVGGAGSGKSSNWKVLQKSFSDLHDEVNYFNTITKVLNPKSIRKGELYCERDENNTAEWINGIVVSHLFNNYL